MDVHLVCKQCTPLPCFYFTLVHDLWMLVKPYQGMTLVTTVNCLFSLNVYEFEIKSIADYYMLIFLSRWDPQYTYSRYNHQSSSVLCSHCPLIASLISSNVAT